MIAILQYNAGNVTSVIHAVTRLGFEPILTDDPAVLATADKVIFPGVGEAATAMKYLQERQLTTVIKSLQQPVLGICLGLQLLCAYSEEGDTEGIGIFSNTVCRFRHTEPIPHMGWNNCCDVNSTLFDQLDTDSDFYFVHSYFADINEHTIATTNYITPFSAALQKDNFYAVQFHPEKSAANGIQLLKNFLTL